MSESPIQLASLIFEIAADEIRIEQRPQAFQSSQNILPDTKVSVSSSSRFRPILSDSAWTPVRRQ